MNAISDAGAALVASHVPEQWERNDEIAFLFNERLPDYSLSLGPEQRLWLRVLHDAIVTFFGRTWGIGWAKKGHKAHTDRQKEAAWWLFQDPREAGDVGSFLWVCRALDIEPAAVRSRCLHSHPKIMSNRLEKHYC